MRKLRHQIKNSSLQSSDNRVNFFMNLTISHDTKEIPSTAGNFEIEHLILDNENKRTLFLHNLLSFHVYSCQNSALHF